MDSGEEISGRLVIVRGNCVVLLDIWCVLKRIRLALFRVDKLVHHGPVRALVRRYFEPRLYFTG